MGVSGDIGLSYQRLGDMPAGSESPPAENKSALADSERSKIIKEQRIAALHFWIACGCSPCSTVLTLSHCCYIGATKDSFKECGDLVTWNKKPLSDECPTLGLFFSPAKAMAKSEEEYYRLERILNPDKPVPAAPAVLSMG